MCEEYDKYSILDATSKETTVLNALTRRLAKKVLYSVDVLVELDHDVQRRRLQIIPQVVEAYSDDEARQRALEIERNRTHEPQRIGEPSVVALRRLEFREEW